MDFVKIRLTNASKKNEKYYSNIERLLIEKLSSDSFSSKLILKHSQVASVFPFSNFIVLLNIDVNVNIILYKKWKISVYKKWNIVILILIIYLLLFFLCKH